MKLINVRIRYINPLLGSVPASKELYTNFVASKKIEAVMKAAEAAKATDEEKEAAVRAAEEVTAAEAANITEYETPGVTVFPRDAEGNCIRYDYQIRGYFKEACKFLRKVTGTLSSKEKAYKQLIDGNIFVEPRVIPLQFDGETSFLQRPLRASTLQGERVALTSSEQIPAGSTEEFTVRCMRDQDVKLVAEWLSYGEYHGSGQWRNSGVGSFEVEKFEVRKAPDLAPKFKIVEVD